MMVKNRYPVGVYYKMDKKAESQRKGEEKMSDTNPKKCRCFGVENADGTAEVAEGSGKRKYRTAEEQKALLNRLRRIEGQVRGLEKMVEENAYCPDILVQASAVNSAVNSFSKELLSSHMKTCVVHDIREGHDEVVDELLSTLQKMMK